MRSHSAFTERRDPLDHSHVVQYRIVAPLVAAICTDNGRPAAFTAERSGQLSRTGVQETWPDCPALYR